ncbi:TPA: restriction endonuclease subunit S [Streptococcus suis]
MPNKDKNIPKRRFKEFENADAWELRKLGEVIEKLKGGVSIAPNDYIEDGYRTIPKGAVNDTGVADMSACKNVSVDFFEKNYFSKTSTGELITSLRDLVPSAPNLGRIVRIVGQFEEFIMPQGVYSLKITDNLLEDFLIAYSNNYIYRSVIQSEKNGSTQVHIRNGEFLNIKIQVPSLPEQEAIGNFFSTLDRHITLHQRKLDKLKSVKQAYLSEMFPAEGERVPKRRFPGFTDAWELRKLGEVADIIGGGTPSTSNSEFWDGDIDWYTPAEIGEQIYVDGSERKITQLGLDKSSATLLPANKTILFTSRAGIGKTAILRSDATTNQGFQSIIVDNNTEPYFIFSMTDKIKNKAISVASGSTFAEISSRALGQLEFMFPSINEQKAIGTFFSTLDQHITLHQRKLEKLKNLKKALLNELFV